MSALFLLLVVDLLIFAPLCGWLAAQKGRTFVEGAIVGAVFGILGVLVIGLAPRAVGQTRACPRCAEQIQAAASVCRFCNQVVEPLRVTPRRGMSPLTLVLLVAVFAGLVWIAINWSTI